MTDEELTEQTMMLADEAGDRLKSGEVSAEAYLAFSMAYIMALEGRLEDMAKAKTSLMAAVYELVTGGDE